jgi:hypothetical protein
MNHAKLGFVARITLRSIRATGLVSGMAFNKSQRHPEVAAQRPSKDGRLRRSDA